MLQIKESPEYVQTSLAGAICAGLEKGRFMPRSQCTCLNLLETYHSNCRASCSYCGLAHNRHIDAVQTFIRVKWPAYPLKDIISRVRRSKHPFKRVCVSMITHGKALKDCCRIIEGVRQDTTLPVSALLAPTVMHGVEDMYKIKEAGADRVGIAIDAATEALFNRHRGRGVNGPHRWDRFWSAVDDAVQVFGPYMVGVHLIVGLGESEQDMVNAINEAHRRGALTHLFSFFPEAGSVLQNWPQPQLGSYRRIQMARYLINEGIIDTRAISYSPSGQIVSFGIDIEPYIKAGLAFMTSGCPGEDGLTACNRPFGNERASEPMRNFPYVPEGREIELIRPQIWDGISQKCIV